MFCIADGFVYLYSGSVHLLSPLPASIKVKSCTAPASLSGRYPHISVDSQQSRPNNIINKRIIKKVLQYHWWDWLVLCYTCNGLLTPTGKRQLSLLGQPFGGLFLPSLAFFKYDFRYGGSSTPLSVFASRFSPQQLFKEQKVEGLWFYPPPPTCYS